MKSLQNETKIQKANSGLIITYFKALFFGGIFALIIAAPTIFSGVLSGANLLGLQTKEAHAASLISYVNQCSAASTACGSVPAHQSGDLFIAFAGRNGNGATTAPTLPSGWTSVTTGTNGSGSNASSFLLACKVATGSSETVTGFTNASSLVVQIYRNTKSGTTATCASTILGTPSANVSVTSGTTETFNALTNTNASSWDVGFGYAPSATAGITTAPTNMTNRSSSGTIVAGHDTNGTRSSFSAANVTLTTSGRILTVDVEIKSAVATTPSFSAGTGTYNNDQSITITADVGDTICYTTNGTTPAATTPGTCSTGTTYSTPIAISTTGTQLQAIATKAGTTNSAVQSATYTLQVAAPSFGTNGGTFNNDTSSTQTSSTTGAVFCYTTDGVTTPAATTPGTCSTGSTGSVASITATGAVIKVLATKANYGNSSVVTSSAFTLNVGAVTSSPGAGTYSSTQSVTLSVATTTGANIRYTTDGSAVSCSSTLYSSAISVSVTTTIKAIGCKTNYNSSSAISDTYTISTPKTISGTLYLPGIFSSADTTSRTLRWSKNGATSSTVVTTGGTGAWSFTSTASDGDVFTIWVDGGVIFGSTVLKYGTTYCPGTPDCTGIKVVENQVRLYSKNGTNITYDTLNDCDADAGTGCSTSNIGFNVDNSTNAITINDGFGLYITGGFDGGGATFAPGASLTTSPSSVTGNSDGNIHISYEEGGGGNLSMGTNALSIGGNFASLGLFSYSGSQTTTFTATGTGFVIAPCGSNFNNVVLNGVGGGWEVLNNCSGTSEAFDGSLTVTTGTLSNASSGHDLTINGGSVTGTGTINLTNGTFTVNGTGNFGVGSAMAFKNLTFGSGTHTLTGTTVNVKGNLTINNGASITPGSGTIVMSGSANQTITDNNSTKQDLGNIQISNTQDPWCNVSPTICNTSWLNRKKITFDNSASSTNLTDFPVLVSLTSSNIDYSKTQNSGQDIRFADPDGTILPYEIEKWDEAGTSLVWVKVPQVNNTNTDYIYMYYNNATASDAQSASRVWDSNFQGVYHLPNGTTLSPADSTGYGHDGMLTVTAPTPTTGKIGGGANFGGSSYILANPTIGSTMTFSAWATWTGAQSEMLFANGAGSPGPDLFFYNGHISWNTYDSDANSFGNIPASASDGNFHNYTAVIDSGTTALYYDGALLGTATYHSPATSNFQIGGQSSYNWTGKIDEARISTVARSADWIKASYLTQNNAMNTFGSEESLSTTGVVLGSSIKATTVIVDANRSLNLNGSNTLSLTMSGNPSATSIGPNSASALTDNSAVGTTSWTNPTNAAASDNSYSTAALGGSTLVDSIAGTLSNNSFGTFTGFGESFSPSVGGTLSSAQFEFRFVGAGTLTAKLYTVSGTLGSTAVPGSLLATSSNSLDTSTVTNSYAYYTFNFAAGTTLTQGGHYFITVEGSVSGTQIHGDGNNTYPNANGVIKNGTWAVDSYTYYNFNVFVLGSTTSHYLKANNFGFGVPSTATIVGIKAEIEQSASGAVIESTIKIVKSNGTIGSTNKSTGATLSGTDSYIQYGSSSDLWGESWAPSDINNSNFGVVYSVSGTGTASVDHMRITVYYTPSPVPMTVNGILLASTGTIDYLGDGVTVPCSFGYYGVGLKPSSSTAQTICPSSTLGGNWSTFTSAQFINPDSLILDSVNNKIYVGDGDGQRIHRFDSGENGTILGANWQYLDTSSIDSYLGGKMAIDAVNNKLYVSDADNGRIVVMDSGAGGTTFGANKQYFGTYGTSTGQFQDPEGIYVDATNNKVYVADGSAHRIATFDSSSGGTHLGDNWQALGTQGSGTNQFYAPIAITSDAIHNKVYVGDYNNHRIVSVDSGTGGTTFGGNWSTFGTSGSGTNQFGFVYDLSVDPYKNKLYATDSNDRITRIDTGTGGTTFGGNWSTFGSNGTGTNQIATALGLKINPLTNKIFVMDDGNTRVIKIDSGTSTLSVSNTLTVGDGSHNGASAATNNPYISAANLTISSGATFTAPAGTLSLTGDFTNNGTFTHNSGTIMLSPISANSYINNIGGNNNTTFYNFVNTTAGSTTKFKNGRTFAFSGTLTATGTASSPISLTSDSAGSQWIVTFNATPTLSNLKIQDGACSGGQTLAINHSLINLGNNGSCWGFAYVSAGGGGGASGGGAGSGGHSGGGGGQGSSSGQSVGDYNPGTVSGDGSTMNENGDILIGGANEWATPMNARTTDASYAAGTLGMECQRLCNIVVPYELVATNFGFNIPTGATITGITGFYRAHSDSDSIFYDDEIFLVKGGLIQVNHDNNAMNTVIGTSDQDVLFGSSASLWSNAWTPADINSSGFGVAIHFNAETAADATIYVDSFGLTVYYTPGVSGGSGGSSGGGGGQGGGGGGGSP